MGEREFWKLSGVSDEDLLHGLTGLVASGAQVDAGVVAHLAEVEERRLHLKAASSSLFDYCLRRLGFSEGEAFLRITATRLARRFPVIFELLAARSIHLSALRMLRDHLTHENHRALLAAASGRSKKEVEVLVAALAPRPDVASSIRKLPVRHGVQRLPVGYDGSNRPPSAALDPAQAMSAAERERAPVVCASESSMPPHLVSQSAESVPRDPHRSTSTLGRDCPSSASSVVELVGAGDRDRATQPCASTGVRALEALALTRYLLRVSVSCEFRDKLERARDLMSHSNPNRELSAVLERALDLLIEKLERQRFGRTERPRTTRKLRTPTAEHGGRPTAEHGDRPVAPHGDRPTAEHGGRPTAEHGDRPVAPHGSRNPYSSESHVTRPDDAQVVLVRGPGVAEFSEAGVERAGEASATRYREPVGRRVRTRNGRAARKHIPNEVRRAIVLRDGEQCTYVDDEGRRCASRAFLQLHHEHAHALGGPSTIANLRLLCGAHNRLLAERDFGRTHQEWCVSRASWKRGAT
jgi:5-methylcytosine-specific restriction endonuclease McrA